MKVVHTKNQVTLLMRLKEEADTDTLRIDPAPHREYVLKKYKWFWIWEDIAWLDPYLRKIAVRELVWKGYSDVIKRLAHVIEAHYEDSKIRPVTIEVRP